MRNSLFFSHVLVPLFACFTQVTFEGVVGNDAFSDIAIDDVEFLENTVCEKTAETLGRVFLFYTFTSIVHLCPGLTRIRCTPNFQERDYLFAY